MNWRLLAIVTSTTLLLGALVANAVVSVHQVDPADEPDHIEAGDDGDRITPLANVGWGAGKVTPLGVAICTTAASNAANVDTDCEPNEISNETSIAVNPLNPDNIIGGANEYQLQFTSSGKVGQISGLPRAHVSFDGGRSWANYPLTADYGRSLGSDPSVAFDAAGRAYYALLASSSLGSPDYDVVVWTSSDGGRNWTSSQVAAGGIENHYLDKEYIVAWGNGNALVAYTDYLLSPRGRVRSAHIVDSVTHDGGLTWTLPQVISGDSDAAFLAMPALAADGRVYVAYFNGGDSTRGLGQVARVVEVSPASGALLAGPVDISTIIDAASDSPVNVQSRPTYQDSEFRGLAFGNLAADPTNAAHLALIWSDMRNSVRPAPASPYEAVTNSDVVVSQSFDHGRTWSSAVAVVRPGDQFQPWGAYDAGGRLRIGTYDRFADSNNHLYDYSLATETTPAGLAFTVSPLSTAMSDPTRDDEWFGVTVDPDFPAATRFLGDYTNVAVVPGTTTVLAYWTDMRDTACVQGRCGHGQHAYFASLH